MDVSKVANNVTGYTEAIAVSRKHVMHSSYSPTWSKVHQLYLHQFSNCFTQQRIQLGQSKLTISTAITASITAVSSYTWKIAAFVR